MQAFICSIFSHLPASSCGVPAHFCPACRELRQPLVHKHSKAAPLLTQTIILSCTYSEHCRTLGANSIAMHGAVERGHAEPAASKSHGLGSHWGR
eukprot:scaffold100534_cov18-Tisochrysis_lutea.AAC.1